jgi:glycerol-3-phosphate acyltransferase PlsX
MHIALDAQAGDYGVVANLKGAAAAVKKLGCKVILVGQKDVLRFELEKLKYRETDNLRVMDSDAPVAMDAEPSRIVKDYANSSIMVCAKLLAEGGADALVSAGNSGATMAACLAEIKRIKGITRPAIAFSIPTTKGVSLILDGGANTDCKPKHLLEFALMGLVYARNAFGIENPSIGILSVGEEENKGNALVREAMPLLKQSGLNFYGPVEGRDIPFGVTDVVVCDGFVGNVVLKFGEGLAKAIMSTIKTEISKKFIYKAGAVMAGNAFRAVKRRMDPDQYGGAPLLGVGGVAIVCHGKSSDYAIFNAIRTSCEVVESHIVRSIGEGMQKLEGVLEKTVSAVLPYGTGI